MNNDSSTSSASLRSDSFPSDDQDSVDNVDRRWSNAQLEARKQRARRKRLEYLDDMLRNFDILIYAELSAVYYLDNSTLRLILRALTQFFYLTPKPAMFPEPPKQRPYIGAILGTNLLCLALHLYFSLPQAGEAMRGYLPGGLLIDFIGQRPPSWKLHLAFFDAVLMVMQLVMLAALIKRQRLKRGISLAAGTTTSTDTDTGTATTAEAEAGISDVEQDLDAEERGERRRESESSMESDDPNESLASGHGGQDLAASYAQYFDAFSSGEVMVADLHIVDTVREQYVAYQNRGPGSGMGFTANFAGSSIGLRVRVNGRTLG